MNGSTKVQGYSTNSWLQSRPDVLLNHLRSCILQPATVVFEAQQEHDRRQENAARKSQNRRFGGQQDAFLQAPGPPRNSLSPSTSLGVTGLYAPGILTSPLLSHSSLLPGTPIISATATATATTAAPGILISPGPGPSAFFNSLHLETSPLFQPQVMALQTVLSSDGSIPPSPSTSAEEFRSRKAPTINVSDSASCVSSSAPAHVGEKRPRPSSFLYENSVAKQNVFLPWTSERQNLFESRIARITASAGLPLAWIENVEWQAFVDDFIPQAQLPSRKVLTSRIIPAELQQYQALSKSRVNGKNATAQCDGWTGENFHHFIAFTMTVNREVHTVKVFDASTERKTAENLFKHMQNVLNIMQDEWKVKVVAFTTDASGESRKARQLLRSKFPHLVTPDCYAHQINLIVGDYFKCKSSTFIKISENATELITWLRSKTFVLASLRELQLEANQPALTVIRAVLTRWTAHYLAYSRLLALEPHLKALVSKDLIKGEQNSQLIIGDARSKAKAREAISIIIDHGNTFWNGLRGYFLYLISLKSLKLIINFY